MASDITMPPDPHMTSWMSMVSSGEPLVFPVPDLKGELR
jgi:hypothetical protein